MNGYIGKILSVNLGSGTTAMEDLDPGIAHEYIGGTGMGVRLAYDRIPPDCDPLGPDNKIIIAEHKHWLPVVLRMMMHYTRHEDMMENNREHAVILDAIRAKDANRAGAALKQNIQSHRRFERPIENEENHKRRYESFSLIRKEARKWPK